MLQTIYLYSNSIGDEGAKAVARVVVSGYPKFESPN
jgi:hypothetical protein